MRIVGAVMAAILTCVGLSACGEGETYAVARPVGKNDQLTWSQGDSIGGYQCADGYDEMLLTAGNESRWRDITVSLNVTTTQVTVQYETINLTAAGYIVHVSPESGVAERQQRFAASGTTRDTVNWHKPASFQSIVLCFKE